MGSGSSRMGSPPPSHLARPHRRRRSSFRRTISSLFVCGTSREMEDYTADLRVDSAEHGDQGKLELTSRHSDKSLGCQADLAGTKSAIEVSPGKCLDGNLAPQVQESNVEASNKEGCSFESIEVIENDETASASHAVNGNCGTSGVSPQLVVRLRNSSSRHSPGPGESSEVSDDSNDSEGIEFLFSESSSNVSDSPTPSDFFRDDGVQFMITSSLGLQELERMQNRQDGSLESGDDMIIPANISSSNHSEIDSNESGRNSRRLFRDAFSRHNNMRMIDSRSFGFSSVDSNHLRPGNRWHHDLSSDVFSDELQGGIRSHQIGIQGSNETAGYSRSENWGSSLDSIDHQTIVCPRGIHTDGSCSCQSNSTAEESAAQAGISRVVLLAEALLEVLDQIYQQPMMLSMSMLSIPAPESVVDSFPVKIYRNAENVDCANDVSQCYICLDEYEEGDEIRVLPCNHEYHMPCVDKWLKEIHGVCPLCRGDVREGLTAVSDSDQEIDSP